MTGVGQRPERACVWSEVFAMGLVRAFGGVGGLVLALSVTVPAAQAAPPANDRAEDAVVVSAIPYTATVDLTDATVDADDVALDASCGVQTTSSIWFTYTPGYDSVLATQVAAMVPVDVQTDVATGTPGAMDVVACSADLSDGVPLEAGTAYYVRVVWREPVPPPEPPLTLHLTDAACLGLQGDDFDGDSCPDLAMGMPDATVDGVAGAGRVEVVYGNDYNSFLKGRQRLDPSMMHVPIQAGAGFGATLVQGWIDDDYLADLVIGIPGLDVGAAQDAGGVVVVFGSPQGLGGRHLFLRQGSVPGSGAPEAGDRFGSALAVNDGVLVVGAPGEDLGLLADAGAVMAFTGLDEGGSPTARIITQAGPVAGTAEAGDQFGSAVTFGPLGMLVVGAPGEAVGSKGSAGAVVVLDRSGGSAIFTQDSAGMGGVAEAGDRLGAAVAYLPDFEFDGYRIAVGVPGEDVSVVKDAGLVAFLAGSARASAPRAQALVVTQDTSGVSGVPEPRDRFGSVLTTWFHDHVLDLVVGVPDEDVGSAVDAGAVTTIHLQPVSSRSQAVVGHVLTQSTRGVTGTVEPGDRLGASLTTIGADPEAEDTGRDAVYAGVPGEDTGGVTDVGFVQAVTSPFTTISPMERLTGQRFGTALSRSW